MTDNPLLALEQENEALRAALQANASLLAAKLQDRAHDLTRAARLWNIITDDQLDYSMSTPEKTRALNDLERLLVEHGILKPRTPRPSERAAAQAFHALDHAAH